MFLFKIGSLIKSEFREVVFIERTEKFREKKDSLSYDEN